MREVAEVPLVCSPLSVVVSNYGKKRLVVNLKYVNEFLWKKKFKYEDIKVALMLLEKGDFLCTLTLNQDTTMWRYTPVLSLIWGSHGAISITYSQCFPLGCLLHVTYLQNC